jgi:hypothetical protein
MLGKVPYIGFDQSITEILSWSGIANLIFLAWPRRWTIRRDGLAGAIEAGDLPSVAAILATQPFLSGGVEATG